jgi:hypothetical protein
MITIFALMAGATVGGIGACVTGLAWSAVERRQLARARVARRLQRIGDLAPFGWRSH